MKYSHAPDPGFMVPENGRDFSGAHMPDMSDISKRLRAFS